jgi:glutamyl/glutaminyl-tRNA synthetase
MKKLSVKELEKKIFEWLPKEMQNPKIVPVIFERISKFGDIKNMIEKRELDFFFKQPEISKEKLIYKKTSPEKISYNIKSAVEELSKIKERNFTKEEVKNVLMQIADKLENKGELLHPVRFALSGLDKSPDPFIIAEILGKNETLERLQKAI